MFDAPIYWQSESRDSPNGFLDMDYCVLDGTHFFVLGLIELPIVGSNDVFSWGAWSSLSADNFRKAQNLHDTPARTAEPPYFGWLSNRIPFYDIDTLNMKVNVHSREPGQKPFIEVEPTDHPLAVEQRNGITRQRVQEIWSTYHHAADEPEG